jgi:hypothetical protein
MQRTECLFFSGNRLRLTVGCKQIMPEVMLLAFEDSYKSVEKPQRLQKTMPGNTRTPAIHSADN